jgi:hypothetical protein
MQKDKEKTERKRRGYAWREMRGGVIRSLKKSEHKVMD